ncbi:hypothetical protein [Vreelandella songnenensis]|nr:hypothetical protein [Halomonas songnenensis]
MFACYQVAQAKTWLQLEQKPNFYSVLVFPSKQSRKLGQINAHSARKAGSAMDKVGLSELDIYVKFITPPDTSTLDMPFVLACTVMEKAVGQ